MNIPDYSYVRGIKCDNNSKKNILYLTIYGLQQVFYCDSNDGKVLNQLGSTTGGSKDNDFNNPQGLTNDSEYLYICDLFNHRIQIFMIESGLYHMKWGTDKEGTQLGEFLYPRCIFLEEKQEIFYIGDDVCVQLFTKNGTAIQRIGGMIGGKEMDRLYVVRGLCVMDDRLYVCDSGNQRIQIFDK